MSWDPNFECETMQESAALMHELWISLLAAGFTKHEASHLIMQKPMCDCGS